MANVDAPSGLKPVRHLFGGEVRTNTYFIASALAENIFTGDRVLLSGTTKQVSLAAAGGTCIGVFAGCQFTNAQGEVKFSRYWPTGQTLKSGTRCEAYVYDDPNILFEIQCDGAFAEADIGQDADTDGQANGSTTTGTSAVELDSTDIGTGDSLHIYDYVRDGVNEVDTNAKVLVLLNEHQLRGTLTEV